MKRAYLHCRYCGGELVSTPKNRKPFCDDACRLWSKVEMAGSEDCWPFKGVVSRGYGRIRINNRSEQAHRAAYSFVKGDPGNFDVLHTCDNRPCCNPAHLYLGTVIENTRDRLDRGRGAVGSKHGATRLTESEIPGIRRLYTEGVAAAKIGAMVGLTETSIFQNRQTKNMEARPMTGETDRPVGGTVEAAPWCKDALFVLTTHGDGEATTLHRGWGAICEALIAVHYFEPDSEQRDEIMARFTDWEIWQNQGGYPWIWHSDYEDGAVTVQRVTDPIPHLTSPLQASNPTRNILGKDRCEMSEHRQPTAPSVDGWQPIESAPKDAALLLYGEQDPLPHDRIHAKGQFVFSGYWDGIDEAWCTTGSTWEGPFYKPTHWMPLPPAPPTERVELSEQSNTDPQPTTTSAAPPSPPAVVDYPARLMTAGERAEMEEATGEANAKFDALLSERSRGRNAPVAQMAEAQGLNPGQCQFESDPAHQPAPAVVDYTEREIADDPAELLGRIRFRDGHGHACWYCKEECSSLAGNPGLWPLLLPLDETRPGHSVAVHTRCVLDRVKRCDDRISAVASEHQAALMDEAWHAIEQTDIATRGATKQALLARLREPDVLDAITTSLSDRLGISYAAWAAQRALARIEEMLK